MLYDIPGRTGVRLPAEVLERAAEHERIVAVKDATSDLPAGADIIARTGLAYYCGDDALNLPWLCVGAAGLVSTIAQVVGRPLADLVAAVDASDLPTARALDRKLAPAVTAIMNVTQGAIMAKAGLELLGVLSNRVTRLPLPSATEAQVALLREGLTASSVLPAWAVAR
jgi:4-hydroxy-tetrahydrodipicolinate synthase